ncbi:MAG: AIDA repeat-containing protein, partial [Lentisphaeria bacterium]|nr:AIDA repeat-containing protein [Lentisphaeria bacterium]
MVIKVDPEYTYVVSPDFDPTVVPEGYIWDETAFKELVKATDKAAADQAIYTYGGPQGGADVDYLNAADLTISDLKYDGDGEVVGTTVTANAFNNTGTVTTDGAIVFSVKSFTNFGEFDLDKTGALTATSAVMNMEDSTINLNAGSTLQGSTVINAGTITVVSDQAAINGAITNNGLIDSVMKSLTVTGDIRNANEDDWKDTRDNTVIKVRDLNVTGNVTNYGVIGTEWQEAQNITISGDLRNFHQIIVKTTLTANSVYLDYIDSEIEEKCCVGYIICGQIIAGEINNASGEISAGADKDAGIAINASGKITNGKADALFSATLQAGDDGCIQAVDALNNIGAGSTVHAGYITVLKGTEAGDLTNDGIIQTKTITVDGSITNSATGRIEIDGASAAPGNLSGTTIGNAGTLTLYGALTLAGDVANSNLLNVGGTVTVTGSITNTETGTLDLKSAGSIAGSVAVANSGMLHIAILSGKENRITADKFSNAEGVGKISIGGSFAGGVASVITAKEGNVRVSDITLTVTSADEKEVTAAAHNGSVAIASGVDYSKVYLSNNIDENAIGTVVQDSTGASYYIDFNAFKHPASALEDGVRAVTTTILIDGATASALQYESETTAAIDGLAFAKDGTNGAAPEEEKNVEFTLTGMNPDNPESYRDLKKGITVGAGVTLTVDKLRQTGEDAVTNINGELRAGTSNSGAKAVVVTDTFEVAAGHVNVNGGALYDCTVLSGGTVTVYEGGYAEDVAMENGGDLEIAKGGVANGVTVSSGGSLLIYNGAKLTGRMTFEAGAEVIPFVGSTLDFDLTQTTAGAAVLLNDLSVLMGTPSYTLTVDGTPAYGTYNLAGGVAKFDKTITVTNTAGESLGTLTVDQTSTIGNADYTLNLGSDNVLSVTVESVVPPTPTEFIAKSDIDGNGVSDVMFVWTGEHGDGNYQHGYWMNGTSEWQSANTGHPANWDNLGNFD